MKLCLRFVHEVMFHFIIRPGRRFSSSFIILKWDEVEEEDLFHSTFVFIIYQVFFLIIYLHYCLVTFDDFDLTFLLDLFSDHMCRIEKITK